MDAHAFIHLLPNLISFVTPTHLVGPGELASPAKGPLGNELAAFAEGSSMAAEQQMRTNQCPNIDMLETSLTRLYLGRADPLSTFSVMLRLNDFWQQESFCFFQCIARYVDRDGRTMVTRVSSHRLAVAPDAGAFLDSVDDEVVPVLLGKEAVYRSMYGREEGDGLNPNSATNEAMILDAFDAEQVDRMAYEAQCDLDATIYNISAGYRLLGLEQGMRG